MRYIGCLLALSCIPLLLFAKWVAFPLSNELAGRSFLIVGYSQVQAHWSLASYGLASYGMMSGLLLLIAAEGFRRERWQWIYHAGAGLLMLMFLALVWVAFAQPRLLKDLAEEADWARAANQFTQNYLPLNLGQEPTAWPFLSFHTLGDRVISGWYFMGIGWYLGLIAALVLIAAGAANVERAARRRVAGAILASTMVVAVGFVLPAALGERALTTAMRMEAQGNPGPAQRRYHEAERLDGWNALDFELQERIGHLDAVLGRTATAEYQVYRAELLVKENQVPSAIANYEALAASGGPLSALAADRAVELWTDYGLQLYQTGAFGAAVEAWQHANNREPRMWLAAFYLARGYFAVGRYEEAARLADKCIPQLSDPQMIADLLSDYADARTRQAQHAPAHQAYKRSYLWDYADNRRGLSGDTGP